jgi:predicted ATPase
MHPEVEKIRQKLLNAPWPQYLRSVKISGLRGWSGQEVNFKFPVSVVVGENGAGKSTVLKAAAVAYNHPNDPDASFYPSTFFVDSAWEKVKGVVIQYGFVQGPNEKTFSLRKPSERWRDPYDRPKRVVLWQDISRVLPLDATVGYARLAKRNATETGTTSLADDFAAYFSSVLGRKYSSIRFAKTNLDVTKTVGVVQVGSAQYSQYHQGAGEDATLDLMLLLQDAPAHSLVIIDEVEASLHPRAQRRLIHFLLWLARTKQIQVIISTHSNYVIEELPLEARIFVSRGTAGVEVFYGVSSNFALTRMDDYDKPDLYLFVEDSSAEVLLGEILRFFNVELARVRCMPLGPADMVRNVGRLAHADSLPIQCVCVLDADQQVGDGCVKLPGTLAPEREIVSSVALQAVKEFAARLGVSDASVSDALAGAQAITNHHEWIAFLSRTLNQSTAYMWTALCAVWVRHCMDASAGQALAEEVKLRLARSV